MNFKTKACSSFLLLSIIVVYFGGWFSWQVHDDEGRDTCQIVEARGFQCETHHVVTHQGYIIELHRILPFPFGVQWNRKRKPVFLQNGLISVSSNWVFATEVVDRRSGTMGANLGLELAKHGYDVWMGNNRGGKYGQRHTRLSSSDSKFWDFTFDEMSEHDVPALLQYVLNTTRSSKVSYIGHSQGTALVFALLASRLDNHDPGHYANIATRMEPIILINPIAKIDKATTWMRKMVWLISKLPLTTPNQPFYVHSELKRKLKSFVCNSMVKHVYHQAMMTISGPSSQTNLTRMAVYCAHLPTSTSGRNLIHFHQLFNKNRFTKYDHGREQNLVVYGQAEAPEYNLSRIQHPSLHVLHSDNDLFMVEENLEQLRSELPNSTQFYRIQHDQANHFDALIGVDTAREVVHRVLVTLAKYN